MTGLAVFTILKAGFVFSGKAGSGIVVARLPDGSWSAPSCIATAGVGWGLQIGAGKRYLSRVVKICGLKQR
jgi:lipid-binding SYLF domain-containing protein